MLTSKSSAEVYSSVDKHRLVLCIKSDQYLMISSGYQHLLAVVFDSDCFAYLALRVAEFIQHNMTENINKTILAERLTQYNSNTN